MTVDIDDFGEVDDGRVIQFAAFLATSDEFDVVDLELVLVEVAVVLFVVALQGGILELQLLHPQLQGLQLHHPRLTNPKDTSNSANLLWACSSRS